MKQFVLWFLLFTLQWDATAQVVSDTLPHSSEEQAIIETMPLFPGGERAMFKYLGRNLKYPSEAYDAQIEGVVYTTFMIRSDGITTDHRIVQGIGHGCDEEVLRVLQEMPVWTPGTQNGIAVDVEYHLPVRFSRNIPPPAGPRKARQR